MTETTKPIYRVVINMDAEGGMSITSDHGEDVWIDITLNQDTIDQIELDLATLHGKHFKNNLYNKNLTHAVNVLHGIFYKAKDRQKEVTNVR